MLEIEYEFREEDLVNFNEAQYLNSKDVQNQLNKNRWIVPSIMVLVGTFYYYYYGDAKSAGYIGLVAALWALLSPRVMLYDMRRQILKQYTPQEKKAMFGTYTLTIDPANPAYLFEKSPSGKNKMAWQELIRVEYGKRYVYIYITLSTALVIPVETIKKGDLEKFAEQAEKMVERYAG
ncbi:YcxB family protein [Methylomicrobium sp. Wu6]|uniref:YcxB family protein n=1 Tax=Methylomicrobium sp. Wu6 TaxID=3107928 RepID=UPI002DD64BF0|nr:YcxB family protein [Methylomicrobium sp. Wu6]MEC4749388.1 YcxB family protein [Methylomicrobium sp. Wu6]